MLQNKKDNSILFITPYNLDKNEISNYSTRLISILNTGFSNNFTFETCSLLNTKEQINSTDSALSVNSFNRVDLIKTAEIINAYKHIKLVIIQHHFDLFEGEYGENFLYLLYSLNKPIIIHFHQVIENPDDKRRQLVKSIVNACEAAIVGSNFQKNILLKYYNIKPENLTIIPYGTDYYNAIANKETNASIAEKNIKILSVSKLNPSENLELGVQAVAHLKSDFPEIRYTIILNQERNILKSDAEKYRQYLINKIGTLKLENNVEIIDNENFIYEYDYLLQSNNFLLFTSSSPKDNAYLTKLAARYKCLVILPENSENHSYRKNFIVPENNDPKYLAELILKYSQKTESKNEASAAAFNNSSEIAWENIAIKYALLIHRVSDKNGKIYFTYPKIPKTILPHDTNENGQINKSSRAKILETNSFDTNSNTLVAACCSLELNQTENTLSLIKTCLNYLNRNLNFENAGNHFSFNHNKEISDHSLANLILALGKAISIEKLLPVDLVFESKKIFNQLIKQQKNSDSPKDITLIIKGLYYYNLHQKDKEIERTLNLLSEKLIEGYYNASGSVSDWNNHYINFSNCTFSESLLYSYLVTKKEIYKVISKITFDFILSDVFSNNYLQIINKKVIEKNEEKLIELSADTAIIIQTLKLFYDVFKDELYKEKLETAFEWFLGKNHIHQQIYNPETRVCLDGICNNQLLTTQSADSEINYLISRLTVETINNNTELIKEQALKEFKIDLPLIQNKNPLSQMPIEV